MFLWCVYFVVIFVFKQKTAYEMRISDWSSDVCSSDLVISCRQPLLRGKGFAHHIRFQNLRNRLLNCWLIEARILCSEGADDGIARLLRLHLCHLGAKLLDLGARLLLALRHGRYGLVIAVLPHLDDKIGRASCRERVCQYV